MSVWDKTPLSSPLRPLADVKLGDASPPRHEDDSNNPLGRTPLRSHTPKTVYVDTKLALLGSTQKGERSGSLVRVWRLPDHLCGAQNRHGG